MRLSENEKRDAIKYLQEGKSLPDKYRFLLFDDDREVELVWNGKTEVLTKNWADWVDYWSVDFDFESREEIIRSIDPDTKEEKEEGTGGYIFENEWQSFRTKKDRKLELVSAEK